ncbi:6-phospho-beta-glucosidase [Gleimia hominis]|uniref:6-phospho-beta-glucosidase n=1 Tax=Gleimia hominis TaxID=595468 RepID=A0ABU3IA81_9ACTO|nr:6-phospho-beta-glucosidase [Gleimia hominis]MDT3767289.1 6-phospho-beta-glucosidase [Gleimia hominis]
MILTILGGGGFRVPLVYQAILKDTSDERVTELRLYDIDESRLQTIYRVLTELNETADYHPRIVATTDLVEAIAGADFIFSAIRVGGTQGRALDEVISLKHGVIGQETVGAGGISYALRGIPEVVAIALQVKKHAPNAWVINFTNPAGIMSEVMQRYIPGRIVGICDSPVGLARRILTALQRAQLLPQDLPTNVPGNKRVHVEYAGLNHLGWITKLLVDGQDVIPVLLQRPDLIESFEEGRLFGANLVQSLGSVPNEYLHYYYYPRENLQTDQKSDHTRGRYLEEQQNRFYTQAESTETGVFNLWERTRLEREQTYMATNREATGNFERDTQDLESGGYDKIALAIMHAIANDVPAELILNVANQGVIKELDDSAVVEIPCRVDGRGIHLPETAHLPDHARGLVVNAKYVERETILAALDHSRADAILALAHHPLVDSFNVATQLLDDLVDHFEALQPLGKHDV